MYVPHRAITPILHEPGSGDLSSPDFGSVTFSGTRREVLPDPLKKRYPL